METVLDAIPDMIVVTDASGMLQYVNVAGTSILGHDRASVLGRSVFELLHPDEVNDAMESFTSTAAGVRVGTPIELRIATAAGGWRVMEVAATNRLNDPELNGIVFSCRDLGARHETQGLGRLTFDHSPVGQVVVLLDGSPTNPNRSFAALFGMSREDIRNRRLQDLVHPDDRPQMIEEANRLRRGDFSKLTARRRYVRADGTTFHGEVSVRPLHDAAGDYIAILVTLEDITAEIEGAAALEQSEAKARALVENSPDIILILYPDGEWEASEQGTRLLGYPKGEDIPGGLLSLVHPDDLDTAVSALAEVLAGTRPADEPLELRVRGVSGEYRVFECVGRNLQDEANIGGVVITARDITTRKLTEARMRAAEARFEIAFEYAPVAISVVDLEGRIVDINPAACTMLGRSRESLLGEPAEHSVHPDDRADAIEATTAQIGGSEAPVEFRLLHSSGETVPVMSHAAMVDGKDDEPAHVITLQTDISLHKQLEDELKRRALTDDLTDLPNRTALSQHLERVLHRRNRTPIAALFIDVDNFKSVNDEFGHAAGDEVLVGIAQHLRNNIRAGDIAARVGGDEFVVVCELEHTDEATVIAERIRLAVQHSFDDSGHRLRVTASVGIALAQPNDDPVTLVRRADTAAYIAKRSGKDRIDILGAPA